jgi:hypothetical protein
VELEPALDHENAFLAKIAWSRGNQKATYATCMIVQVRPLFEAKPKTTSEMKVVPLTLLIIADSAVSADFADFFTFKVLFNSALAL